MCMYMCNVFQEGETVTILNRDYIILDIHKKDKNITMVLKYCEPNLVVSGNKMDQKNMCDYYRKQVFNGDVDIDVRLVDVGTFDNCWVDYEVFCDKSGTRYSWWLEAVNDRTPYNFCVSQDGDALDVHETHYDDVHKFRPTVKMSFSKFNGLLADTTKEN